MIIVKIGGGSSLNLTGIAADLAAIEGPVVVVHGANALRAELAGKLGLQLQRVVSASGVESVLADTEAIELMMMAYAGARNKRLVEVLQQHGVNAIGLSGLDGRIVEARRNPGIRARSDGKLKLVRDLSGKPTRINRPLLQALLDLDLVPVLTVPLIDEQGVAVSSENDDLVALLQAELGVSVVVQLIEAAGLLRDPGRPTSFIPRLTAEQLQQRLAETSGRMKRKLMAIARMLESGVSRVVIGDGRLPHPLVAAIDGCGTVIG